MIFCIITVVLLCYSPLVAMELPSIPEHEEMQFYPTPLINAAQEGNVSRVEELLRKNFNTDERDSDNNTPLIKAAQKYVATKKNKEAYLTIIRSLLQNKANINAQNKDGYTALMIAAKANDEELITLLMGYYPNQNLKNKRGKTAADLAKSLKLKTILSKQKIV